jgi:hypothetical protein
VIGAGTFINPLIKIVTTVAILAAVYFFILKPGLDFGSDVSDDVSRSVGQGLEQAERAQRQAARIAKQQGAENFNVPYGQTSAKDANRLLDCVQRVQPDTARMQACAERFGP